MTEPRVGSNDFGGCNSQHNVWTRNDVVLAMLPKEK